MDNVAGGGAWREEGEIQAVVVGQDGVGCVVGEREGFGKACGGGRRERGRKARGRV